MPSNSDPIQKFSRWKYAEEHAHGLVNAGRLVRLTIEPDVAHVDPHDGETYVYDDFIVEDLGERPAKAPTS